MQSQKTAYRRPGRLHLDKTVSAGAENDLSPATYLEDRKGRKNECLYSFEFKPYGEQKVPKMCNFGTKAVNL